jgi:bifunctional DNA-binding transcriptional regulator/antitoxin component of YhaV-PrlF toxin-antitoxin module
MSLVKTRKVGGSLIITIPKEMVEREGLTEGEIVEVRIKKIGKDFFGALKGIGSFTPEDELKAHE